MWRDHAKQTNTHKQKPHEVMSFKELTLDSNNNLIEIEREIGMFVFLFVKK
jgi:hypothetical protein